MTSKTFQQQCKQTHYNMKEQILRNLIRESVKKMISESKTLKEYSGDSGLEELAESLGYDDVIEFFEDNSGAVDAVYKWVESIPALKQKLNQSGMVESKLKENSTADRSITTQKATEIANKFAKYMSTKENKKFMVTKGSVEGPSFDLDVNGLEYEGGSYIINTRGDIVNVADQNKVYGNVNMLESKLRESDDAYLIHRMTGAGQDGASNFIDSNSINVEKLINDLKRGIVNKYEVRDVISGTADATIAKKFHKAYSVNESIKQVKSMQTRIQEANKKK